MDDIAEQDIVILSKEILKGITRPFIPESCPIIIANREVNIAGTKELIQSAKRTTDFMINDTIEHARKQQFPLKIFILSTTILHMTR